MIDEELDANLRWWLTVTEILEREGQDTLDIVRWRLSGADVDECRKRLNERPAKGRTWTRERVRRAWDRARKHLSESMTPPRQWSKTTVNTESTSKGSE